MRFLPLMLLLLGCDDKEADDDTGGGTTVASCTAPSELSQGIWGSVIWREGNWMPGDGPSGGTQEPVSTTVAAFAALSDTDVTQATDKAEAYGRFLTDQTPVATTTSDAEGCFSLTLDPGDYSVVSDDDGAWYCNGYSSAGLCVSTVAAGAVVEVQIVVDYMAAY